MTANTWLPWREAMTAALYGDDGFYRRAAGPAAHFRTSVHASPLFAKALLRLAHRVEQSAHNPPTFAIVDAGSGRGELLQQLAPVAPPHWQLIGVDLVGRPDGLHDRITWYEGLPALPTIDCGLLIANELLDNVPLNVVEGGHYVEVRDDGTERQGSAAAAPDQHWRQRWLPHAGRAEIGRTRDDLWAGAVAKVALGAAIAIDYRLVPAIHGAGTLTGFRDGHQVAPVPDGSCDLTAHVLLESCAEAAGGDRRLLDQRSALKALGLTGSRPPRELASSDPTGYLRALAEASQAAELLDPAGFGGFGWLVHRKGIPEVLDPDPDSLG